MARLPQPGGDAGNWGTILNEYLSQSHNDDGTLKPLGAASLASGAITADAITDGAVTETKLDAALLNKINSLGGGSITFAGDVTGANDATVVSAINGVTVSGTPTAGQVLQSDSDTTASWQPAPTPSDTLDGDVTGTLSVSIVAAVNGVAVSGSPTAGDVLTATNRTSAGWHDGTAVTMAGDVEGSSDTASVKRVRGVTVRGVPAAGKVLKATSATNAKWQPDATSNSTNAITITDNYTAGDGDIIFADCTDGNLTVTLPAPSNGAYVTIKKVDDTDNSLEVVGAGSATIDGQTSWTDSANQDSQHFISDGTNWYLTDMSVADTPPPSGDGVLARSAWEFLESVGVALKFGEDQYAANTDVIRDLLVYTGARYVRSRNIQASATANQIGNVLSPAFSDGIRRTVHTLTMKDETPTTPVSTIRADINARLSWFVNNDVARYMSSMESLNERDNKAKDDWAKVLGLIQPELYSIINDHSNADIKRMRVGGPSLTGFMMKTSAKKVTNDAAGKPLYQSMDFGCLHSYPGGRYPEMNGSDFPTKAKGEVFSYSGADPTGSDNIDDRLKYYAKYVTRGQRPIIITETGYHNYIWPAETKDKGHRSTPLKAGGIYMPRLFLENFRVGIERTHIYEAIDNPTRREQETALGMLQKTGATYTPKTWTKALHNMTTLLRDGTDVASPGRLPFTWSAGSFNNEFTPLLFQKSDGSFWIAVWRRISVCDYDTPSHNGVDITPTPWTRNITFTFGTSISLPTSVTKHIINYDSENTDGTRVSLSGRSFTIAVSPQVQLIKIAF